MQDERLKLELNRGEANLLGELISKANVPMAAAEVAASLVKQFKQKYKELYGEE